MPTAPLGKGFPPLGKPRHVQFILVLLAYFLTGWLGLLVPFENEKVTLFWLPSGIALAAFYRWSPKLWPSVFLAALLINCTNSTDHLMNILLAAGNTLSPLATLWLLRHFKCDLYRLNRTNTVYFLIIGALGMTVSALVGGALLGLQHNLPLDKAAYIALAWWMGDSLGVFLAVPLLVNANKDYIDKVSARKVDFLIVISVSLIVGLICFPLNSFDNGNHLPIVFTTFVCIAWASLWFGLFGSGVTTIGFCFLAIWSAVNQWGPFVLSDMTLSFWLIWGYAASMTILGLMITAAHLEISTTNKQLSHFNLLQQDQKTHLQALLNAIPDLLFELDRNGEVISCNGSNNAAVDSPVVPGKNLADTLDNKSLALWMLALHEADHQGVSQGKSIGITADHNTLIWYELSIAKRAGLTPQDDRFICLARDITKRIQTHETDLANEQRFRNIFETTRNIAVQGYNRKHQVIFWNKASEDLYGYSAAQAMGKKLEDLIIPVFMRTAVYQAIEDWYEKNQSIPSSELALVDAKGNEVWVYSNHVLIDTLDHKEMYCLDINLGPQRNALIQLEQELAERKQIESALRESEQLLEQAQIMARITHWRWDPESDHYQLSPATSELFGLDSTLLSGKLNDLIDNTVHEDDRTALRQALHSSHEKNQHLAIDIRIKVGTKKFWLELQADNVSSDKAYKLQGSAQDITERKGLDLALAAAAADAAAAPDFFVTILRALADALGAEHVLISLLNPTDPGEARTHTYLKHGESQANFTYALKNTPCADVVADNVCYVSADAKQRYPYDDMLELHNIECYLGAGIRNAQGETIGILVVLSEQAITVTAQISSLMFIFADRIGGELRRAQDQEQIYNLAFFDPLTHLPNRRMLQDRLKLVTSHSARSMQYGALLFIDIDHFKLLNDTRGHQIGDQLLILVAERISSIIRVSDLAARLGGDEFVVVFDNLGENAETAALEAKKRAEQLHDLINLPYPLRQSVHHCTISIGVSLFNGQNTSIDDLLRHADAAMYQAKDSGRNAIRFFDPNMQSHLEKRAAIESDLRSAHESNQQLIPYYQVQINQQGKAIGAELLLRWQHPEKGMISPADFIPVAERTGLIVAIGRQVIRHACEQLKRWSTHPGFSALSIAVNVSPIQFNQAEFVDEVLTIVGNSKINPRQLKLELTESSLLKNVDQSIEKMQQLQNSGIGFSMDDFGIGYSSLSYLKRLPLDQLKIDQTFVRDIAVDPNDAIIARTIIAMAQNMNLQVIAEGVETITQKEFLEQNGCCMFQGYFFGRPMPVAELELQLIARHYC